MDQKESMDAVMRRIEKLLAMARDTRGNANETAAAASMAARLMNKFQLSEADVIIAKMKAGEDLESADYVPTLAEWKEGLKRVPRWASLLTTQIGRLTETQACLSHTLTDKGMEACVRFMGFGPDVKLAVYTMMYLQGEIRRFRADFIETYTYKTKGFTALRSYTDGLTIGICSMLQEEIEAREADKQQNATGTALVVAKAAAIAERFGEPLKPKKINLNPKAGFSDGVRDGKSVAIRRAIPQGDFNPSQLQLPNLKV